MLTSLSLICCLGIDIGGGNMRLVPTRCLTTTMLEVIMGGIGSSLFQISQDRVGTLYRKVPQKAAATFPEFQVSHLQKILDQGPGWLAPPGCSAQDCEADRPAHTGKELLPYFIAAPVGAETDDLGQGQGRITCHFKSVRHSARCGYQWVHLGVAGCSLSRCDLSTLPICGIG